MSHWVKVREFATRLEADVARVRIEAAHIPVTIQSHEAGMFGAGFQGPVPTGVEVQVPSERLAEARSLLESDSIGSG